MTELNTSLALGAAAEQIKTDGKRLAAIHRRLSVIEKNTAKLTRERNALHAEAATINSKWSRKDV